MFTLFFGNFLLNSGYITIDQLTKVLEDEKNTKVKMGILAINSNFMTAEQVKKVHHMQSRVDKKFGELAIQLGYMTDEQVMHLIGQQKNGYLLLSQTIIDNGFMTLSDLEKALNDYKELYRINDIAFNDSQNEMILPLISEFYNINRSEAHIFTDYILIVFRNLVRFIGEDFIPMKHYSISEMSGEVIITQNINGKYSIFSAIEGNKKTMLEFANRFCEEGLTEFDEYAGDCVGEFLNLVNGIFAVNQSNYNSIEYEQTPQEIKVNAKITNLQNAMCIPIHFTFGDIKFVIADNKN